MELIFTECAQYLLIVRNFVTIALLFLELLKKVHKDKNVKYWLVKYGINLILAILAKQQNLLKAYDI